MKNLEIELDANYDYDSAQHLFDESVKVLQYSTYSQNSICLYTDYGNLPSYDLEDIIPEVRDNKTNRTIIARFIKNMDYTDYDTIKEVLEYLDLGSMLDYAGFNDEDSYDDKVSFLDDLGVTYDDNFIEIVTRGYGQGDYAEVFVNKADFERELGVKLEGKRIDDLKAVIDHIFWDAQISGTLYISFEKDGKDFGAEIELWEILTDPYDLELSIENVVFENVNLTDEEKKQIQEKLSEFDPSDVKSR